MANGSLPSRAMLPYNDTMLPWHYLPTPSQDLAQEAFEDALVCFRKEFHTATIDVWLQTPTTIEGVLEKVRYAQQRYETKAASRRPVMQCLNRFSRRIMHYGKVFDMLAQHHPEYVSLAWGAVKFIFMVVIDHETLLVEIAGQLSEIGGVLPRIELNAELYQTSFMKQAIAQLYAHILIFFQRVVKYYSLGSVRRVLSSIGNPYELDYKDSVEQIQACSRTVEDIANAAARTEVRDIHVLVQLQHQKVLEMQKQLDVFEKRVDGYQKEVMAVSLSHKTITESIHIDVQDMKPRIHEIHISAIVDHLRPEFTPEESLLRTQSLVKRSQTYTNPPQGLYKCLREVSRWLSSSQSAMFILKSGIRAESQAKDIALGIIKLLQTGTTLVLWYFPSTKDECDLCFVLRSLVFQALRQDAKARLYAQSHLTIKKLQDSHSESEWMDLLCGILCSATKCYMILDMDGMSRRDSQDSRRLSAGVKTLLDRIAATGCVARVMIVNAGSTSEGLGDKKNAFVASIRQGAPIPVRLRRTGAAVARRKEWWRNVDMPT